MFHFYTGVSLGTFTDVAKIVGDSLEGGDNRGRPKGRSTLTRKDELFMVLCKLRHDFPESDLASRFNVSQPTISRIFSNGFCVSRIHSKNWTFGLARSLFKHVYLLAIIRQNEHKTTMLKYIKFSSGHTSEIQETGGKFIRKSGVRAGET